MACDPRGKVCRTFCFWFRDPEVMPRGCGSEAGPPSPEEWGCRVTGTSLTAVLAWALPWPLPHFICFSGVDTGLFTLCVVLGRLPERDRGDTLLTLCGLILCGLILCGLILAGLPVPGAPPLAPVDCGLRGGAAPGRLPPSCARCWLRRDCVTRALCRGQILPSVALAAGRR